MANLTITRSPTERKQSAAPATRSGSYARRLLLGLSLFCILIPGMALRPEPTESVPLANVKDDGSRLPSEARMEELARTDPIAFLQACIVRYNRQVHGYRCILHKRERLEGKLQDPEEIDVSFREDPFSVFFEWREGARKALRVLYVEGENKDQLVVKPKPIERLGLTIPLPVVTRDPLGADARASGRYPLTEFGIAIGTRRTLYAMDKARKEHALHVEYLGLRKIKELDDRACYVFRRTGYRQPEESDGITELTFYVDKETWLQTGSILKGKGGQLLGEFFFRKVELNPTFPPDTFTRAAVAR
jgi:hypothetical protein